MKSKYGLSIKVALVVTTLVFTPSVASGSGAQPPAGRTTNGMRRPTRHWPTSSGR
jgi:hypothetical protein